MKNMTYETGTHTHTHENWQTKNNKIKCKGVTVKQSQKPQLYFIIQFAAQSKLGEAHKQNISME
jgi:hypothetical protein